MDGGMSYLPYKERAKNLEYWRDRDARKKAEDPAAYRAAAAARTRDYRARHPDRVVASKARARTQNSADPEYKERIARLKDRKVAWIEAYFVEHPCVDCGETDRDVLDFDHVRGEKRFNVAQLRSGPWSLQRLIDEVAKCDVRCSNCHRKITRKREREGLVEAPWVRSARVRAERRAAKDQEPDTLF
jgi:hypothetical protein